MNIIKGIAACLVLAGCSVTKIYDRDGNVQVTKSLLAPKIEIPDDSPVIVQSTGVGIVASPRSLVVGFSKSFSIILPIDGCRVIVLPNSSAELWRDFLENTDNPCGGDNP